MKSLSNKFLFFILLTLCAGFFFFNIKSASAETNITDNIQASTIWTKDGNPFIIKNSIEVALGITLTISPGVIVKFDPTADASITVFGDLVINGEENDKVYFTSNYDDTLGGDTDGDYYCYEDFDEEGNSLGEVCDGSWLVPSRNDWQGINFIDSHNDYIKNTVFKYVNNLSYLDHTYLNLKNVEVEDSNFGIFANVSNIDADVFNCKNLVTSCLYSTNGSNVSWINSTIDTIHRDAVYVYDSSILSLSNFSIKNIYDSSAIYVFENSYLNANNYKVENVFDDFNYGVYIFNNSHASFKNSTFKKAPNGSDIILFDTDDHLSRPSSLNVENSIFEGGNGSAILAFGEDNISAKISNSIIKNFDYFAIQNYSSAFTINAEDNFWGNDTGPFHADENSEGTAGIVSDYVDFLPFCENVKCKPRDPVILIPGIMGTEILKGYDDNSEIWPNINKMIFSITDNFLNDLALNSDGTENSIKPMKLGDIVRGTRLDILGIKYNRKTWEGLISFLKREGYIENVNLFVFPYDWRKSNANSALRLNAKINEILTNTGADKVDLVAHSMGGLVAKKYIADNGASKVDQLIFMGTPQLGAPEVFKAIVEGNDMGIKIEKLSLLSPDRVKYIIQNMPGVFELLPSKKYIDGQGNFLGEKYITDYTIPSFSNPGSPVLPLLSYKETENFLKSQNVNKKMLDFSNSLHNDIDNLDLSNVKVSNFIGCGTTKTIGHITVKKKTTGILLWKKIVNTYDLEYENGDDTVPLHSVDDSIGKKYYVKGSTHGELPSAPGIEELVTATLRGKKLIDFPNVSFNEHDCFIKGKTITLKSMLPMMDYLIYDGFGNYTGPVKSIDLKSIQDPNETNEISTEIEYGIPGVQYDKIGGTTSIFLPAGGSYKIVVKNTPSLGTGGGSGSIINAYDLSIQNINDDDTIINSTNFNNISVENSNENFQIDIPANTFPGETNVEVPPTIQVDDDGDGMFENEISPTVILNDIQVNDISVPTTTSLVLGNTLSLSASDNGSGILNTQYSLDGGNAWANYVTPIEIPVIAGGSDVTVQYFSIDNAGNIEPIQTITIPALLLPAPATTYVPSIHNSGGGIILLNLNNNLEISKNILHEEPQIFVSDSLLKKPGILINKITTEDQVPILNNLNIPILKKTAATSIKELYPLVENKKTNRISQTALPLNSGFSFKRIWILVVIFIFSGTILIVRNYKKR
ncbi:MAG: hypothetical protein WCI93_01825 [bacterium]